MGRAHRLEHRLPLSGHPPGGPATSAPGESGSKVRQRCFQTTRLLSRLVRGVAPVPLTFSWTRAVPRRRAGAVTVGLDCRRPGLGHDDRQGPEHPCEGRSDSPASGRGGHAALQRPGGARVVGSDGDIDRLAVRAARVLTWPTADACEEHARQAQLGSGTARSGATGPGGPALMLLRYFPHAGGTASPQGRAEHRQTPRLGRWGCHEATFPTRSPPAAEPSAGWVRHPAGTSRASVPRHRVRCSGELRHHARGATGPRP